MRHNQPLFVVTAILAMGCGDSASTESDATTSPDAAVLPIDAATIDAASTIDAAPDAPTLDASPADAAPQPDAPVGSVVATAGPGLALTVPQSPTYDGTLATMVCVDLAIAGAGTVADYAINVAMDHVFVGDLTIKLVAPSGTTALILNRPGHTGSPDTGGMLISGTDTSDVIVAYPIRYAPAAATSADSLGGLLPNAGVACRDDGKCQYKPDPDGAASGNVIGESVNGTWKLCVGDSDADATDGVIDEVALAVVPND